MGTVYNLFEKFKNNICIFPEINLHFITKNTCRSYLMSPNKFMQHYGILSAKYIKLEIA